MRVTYAMLAAVLMTLAFAGVVTPLLVLIIATLAGLVRPSDLGVRGALVAETMPNDRLIGAMSIARTTSDSARVAGALAGAGVFALFGMGPAYVVITCFYVIGALLTLGIAAPRRHISLAHDAGRSASVAVARPQGRPVARLEHADFCWRSCGSHSSPTSRRSRSPTA